MLCHYLVTWKQPDIKYKTQVINQVPYDPMKCFLEVLMQEKGVISG